MPLPIYFDVHIPAAITEALRRRGIDILTSQEDGTREITDERILQRSVELNRALFSQDRDLLRLAKEWQTIGEPFPGVIFSPQMNVSIGRLIDDLELIACCSEPTELADKVIYLPLP